jgi:small conductance mechanosensitive channel
MDNLMDTLLLIMPLLITLSTVVIALILAHKILLNEQTLTKDNQLSRKLILLLLYVLSFLGVSLALPVADSTRNQVIGLFGIVLSGVIAFSSTSIVGNIMAGIVLRFTKPFKTGDFIRVDQYFGRVTEKGLFDTEIQTEQRELVAFTNSFLTSNPITVTRTSGTILSANLSIGYDHHHDKITQLLITAANNCQLEEPFVQIIELGNYSISYRVSGLLTEVKSMISSRSRLYANILDTLHQAQVEIMSPNFMNTRNIADAPPAIPKATETPSERMPKHAASNSESTPEDMIFDKAEEAEQKERSSMELSEDIKALNEQLKDAKDEQKDRLELQIARKKEQLRAMKEKHVKED